MAKKNSHLDAIDQQTQALANTIKDSIAELAAQIVPLNERYRRITGDDFAIVELSGESKPFRISNGKAVAKSAAKPSKRIRRSSEELKKMADTILAFVKKSGAEGVKGAAIRAEFGPLLPSIKEFVRQHGGKSLKTKGAKAAMTYHHSD